jgi:hypothetical protein
LKGDYWEITNEIKKFDDENCKLFKNADSYKANGTFQRQGLFTLESLVFHLFLYFFNLADILKFYFRLNIREECTEPLLREKILKLISKLFFSE